MVEAGELAKIFQWQTPEDSRHAHGDATVKQRIGEEVADVLLYLLQVADHCQVDVSQAVRDKLVKNAFKYPAKRAIRSASSPSRRRIAVGRSSSGASVRIAASGTSGNVGHDEEVRQQLLVLLPRLWRQCMMRRGAIRGGVEPVRRVTF